MVVVKVKLCEKAQAAESEAQNRRDDALKQPAGVQNGAVSAQGDDKVKRMRACPTHGLVPIPQPLANFTARLLAQLAARHRFSDPTIQKKRDCDIDTDAELKDIFIRIESVEAKWLVRLLLRQYCTIELDEDFVLEQYHFLLPDLLKFQNDFDVASSLLLQDMSTFPSVPDPASKRAMRIEAAEKLKPTVGVKVGRPTFYKAWVSHYNPSINDHVH